jgi:type I restriction enzyme S subunit
MRSNYKRLGLFIREVVVTNDDLSVTDLRGVNVGKVMMPSKANIIGTDLSKYKIARHHQFVYGPVTSRNGERIAIALVEQEECILSVSYTVFEIIDREALLPEYVMMWFKRPEFDRYARFMSHGSVREIFGWEELCDVELPVPSPGKQREIVAEYKTVVSRIALNEKLGRKLEETAQAIYKHWFVDFEFPMSAEDAKKLGKPELEGKPYKSSGGEMVFLEDLDQEIPVLWNGGKVQDLFFLQRGFDITKEESDGGKIPVYSSSGLSYYHSKGGCSAPGIVTGRKGKIGDVFLIYEDYWPHGTTLWVKQFRRAKAHFTYFFLKSLNLVEMDTGSANPTLNRNHVHALQTIIPDNRVLELFEIIAKKLIYAQLSVRTSANSLEALRALILSRISLGINR